MSYQNIDNAEFQQAITIFRPSATVLTRAKLYLQEFLSHFGAKAQPIDCLPEIAVFVAESCQEVKDLRGKRVSGIGLSLSRLISNFPFVEQWIERVNEFIGFVTIEAHLKQEIRNHVNKLESMLLYARQFEKYVEILELISAETVLDQRYQSVFIELAWMMYLDCREHFLRWDQETEVEKCDCLLASVFYFMIRYSLNYIYPHNLSHLRHQDKRTMVSHILEYLLDVFNIQDIELFRQISTKYDKYGEELIDKFILRTVGSEIDFFSPFIIQLNFKQLQNRYQKALAPQDIDYRALRNQKLMTPINKEVLLHRVGLKKQAAVAKKSSQQYKSHRALNYELQTGYNERAQGLNSLSESLFDIQNQETLSLKINMKVCRHLKLLTKDVVTQDHIFNEKVMKAISLLYQNSQPNNLIDRKSYEFMVYHVYESLKSKGVILSQNLQNEGLHESGLAVSFFVVSLMFSQENIIKPVTKYLLADSYSVLIDLWACLNSYQATNRPLPSILLRNIKQQKENIICNLIWKNNEYVDQIAELAANYQKPESSIKFAQNLLLYAQNLLKRFQRKLNLNENHCICAYNCFKFILSANGNVIINRHIDQILMCCLYIAGKASDNAITFHSIKQAYQYFNWPDQAKCQSILNEVYLHEGETENIIAFYNKQFIENIRPFLPYMANPSLHLLHPLFQRELQFEQENYLPSRDPTDIANLMETKKPKPPSKIYYEINHDGPGIVIKSHRNETKLRVRPKNLAIASLCETERMKRSRDEFQSQWNQS